MIDFNLDVIDTAADVCHRAEGLVWDISDRFGDRSSRLMDLCAAAGRNGNADLDFERLMQADNFNFLHDVLGIHRHMNRQTGQLEDGFLPRFSKVSS